MKKENYKKIVWIPGGGMGINMNNKNNGKRISLEIIRIIALLFVIYNHTGETGYELFSSGNGMAIRVVAIILGVICKAGVPLFFMISGVLLLGRDESIKDVLEKRVLRYAIIIIVFSFVYYLRMYLKNPEYGFNIKFFVKTIYENPFIIPYWFLYAYLAFLVMLPFLRAIVKGISVEHYLLLFSVMIIISYSAVIERALNWNQMYFTVGLLETNIIYPIIGYGIGNVFSDKYFEVKARIAVFCLFAVNLGLTLLMSCVELRQNGVCTETYISRFSFIPAITVFYFCIYVIEKKGINVNKEGMMGKLIFIVGSGALCTYLFEDMLRSDLFLPMIKCSSNQWINLVMIIPYSLCIIACGIIISLILKRIPVINKLKL